MHLTGEHLTSEHLTSEIEILIVEPSPTTVQWILQGLTDTKKIYKPRLVADGLAALDYLNQRPPFAGKPLPHLILLGLHLPKRTGAEVLDRLKSDSKLRRIPVVVLTSTQSEAEAWTAYDKGANSYLKKPASLRESQKVVRTLERYAAALSGLQPLRQPASAKD